jgi:pimeloyl-ACP methyl ester carboxylesterase
MHYDRQTVATDVGSVAYVESGRGPDVILIHGALVTADDLVLSLFETLAQRFHVVAFDRPGHGGTDQTATEQGSPWAQAAMLQAASRALGLQTPVVFGHSFGGAVALCTAMAFPDAIAGVVAAAPICFPEPRLEQMLLGPRALPVVGPAMARTAGVAMDAATLPLLRRAMFLPQAMPARYAETFPFAWASRPEQMIADARDSLAMWPALTRSALSYRSCRSAVAIVGGTHDMVVNNALHGQVAASLIPHARFRWSLGSGHMLHHFEQAMLLEEIERMADIGTRQAHDYNRASA